MLEKAKTQIQKYRKEYESLGNRGIKSVLKEGSLVWYKDPSLHRTKLAPRWTTKAKIIGTAFESYKLQDEFGKTLVANKRLVKERFDEF